MKAIYDSIWIYVMYLYYKFARYFPIRRGLSSSITLETAPERRMAWPEYIRSELVRFIIYNKPYRKWNIRENIYYYINRYNLNFIINIMESQKHVKKYNESTTSDINSSLLDISIDCRPEPRVRLVKDEPRHRSRNWITTVNNPLPDARA